MGRLKLMALMAVLAMVVGGLTVLGCGDDEGPAPIRKLASITVTHSPAGDIEEGAEVQFTATGTYDRAPLEEDITGEVTLSVIGDGSIDANGLFTAGDPDCEDGAATVTAELEGIEGEEAVTITNAPLVLGSIAVAHTPAGDIAEAATAQFTATGSYDECDLDITSIVTWSYTGDGASISATGLLTAGDPDCVDGTATVTAELEGVEGEEAVTITNAPLVLGSIAVAHTPGGVIAEGATAQFTATGSYDECGPQDITSIVTWSYTGDGVSITAAGLFTAGDPDCVDGTAGVKAELGGIADNEIVTITNALLVLGSIAVAHTPAGVIAEGATAQFTATGSYDECVPQDITSIVTWTCTGDGGIDVVSGLFTAGDPDCVDGAVTVTAALGGVEGEETVTITNASLVLLSIAVTHADPQLIDEGATAQFTAMGGYDECVPQDITSTVTWSYTGDGASITAAGLFTADLLTPLEDGAATVIASLSGIDGNEAVSVINVFLVVADPSAAPVPVIWEVDTTTSPAVVNGITCGTFPFGVAIDSSGNYIVTDIGEEAILKVDPDTETVTSVTAGPPLAEPYGIAIDSSGNYIVAGINAVGLGAVFEVTPGGLVSTTYSGDPIVEPYGITIDGSGNYIVADISAPGIYEVDVTGPVTVITVILGLEPVGIAIDSSGNYIVTDLSVPGIFEVTPAGSVIEIYSGALVEPMGIAIRSSRCFE